MDPNDEIRLPAEGPAPGSPPLELQKAKRPEWETMAAWKVKAVLAVCCILSFLNGYDVSNIANIQSELYEAFGNINILPWAGLGFTAGSATTYPLFRKLIHILEMKTLMIVAGIIFAVGIVVNATAASMVAVIVGRVINGIGAGGLTQLVFAYLTLTMGPNLPKAVGLMGMTFAIGLVCGPIVGGALADNEHATWRWAIWLPLPFFGLTIPAILVAFPVHLDRDRSQISLATAISRIDWAGIILHIASVLLILLALTFSGPVYAWSSGSAIALWVVWGVVFTLYVVQQAFCIFTTRAARVFPAYLLTNRTVGPVALCTACAGISYAGALYYLPLYYAFTRGLSPLNSAVRLLPYIGVFIVIVILAGGLLPVVRRYAIFYAVAGPMILIGGVLLASQLSPSSSEGTAMGFSSLLAIGTAVGFHHGLSISGAALPIEQRLDGSALQGQAQMLGVALSLGMAGCIFQNKGYDLLREVMEPRGYSDLDIRQALGGLKSSIWTDEDPQVQALAIEALTQGICKVFYLFVAAGAICTLAAAGMKWEKLDFKRPAAKSNPSDEEKLRQPDAETSKN